MFDNRLFILVMLNYLFFYAWPPLLGQSLVTAHLTSNKKTQART